MDIEDDEVVRELTIYSSNNLENQLTLFQFPLRPPWRPYDMSEVTEVRCKHRLGKVEMDFPPNTTPEFFNEDNQLKLPKFTLTSNQIQLRTNFAVGVVRGDELHLTPIHNVIQLRPSFEHIDKIDEENKRNAKKEEKEDDESAVSSRTNEDDEDTLKGTGIKPIQVQFKRKETPGRTAPVRISHAAILKAEATEPWTKLYFYNDPKSYSSEPTLTPTVNINEKMDIAPSTNNNNNNTPSSSSSSSTTGMPFQHPPPIIPRIPPKFKTPFFDYFFCKDEFRNTPVSNAVIRPERYLELMCSAAGPLDESYALKPRSGHNPRAGLSLDELKKLPLEKQIFTIMNTGHAVRFSKICELATKSKDPLEVIAHLEKISYFVANRWVIKSEQILKEPSSIYRDYILLLLCNNEYVNKRKAADDMGILTEMVKEMLSRIAMFVPTKQGWTWKIEDDLDFVSLYPEVAKKLKSQWEAKRRTISNALKEVQKENAQTLAAIDKNAQTKNNPSSSISFDDSGSLSEQFTQFLRGVLSTNGVCSREFLFQEFVRTKTRFANEGKKTLLSQVTDEMFDKTLNEIAGFLHHSYYLKTVSPPALDRIREIVIGVFSKRGISVKRTEVIDAITSATNSDVRPDVINTVLSEFSVALKGGKYVWKNTK